MRVITVYVSDTGRNGWGWKLHCCSHAQKKLTVKFCFFPLHSVDTCSLFKSTTPATWVYKGNFAYNSCCSHCAILFLQWERMKCDTYFMYTCLVQTKTVDRHSNCNSWNNMYIPCQLSPWTSHSFRCGLACSAQHNRTHLHTDTGSQN